MITNKSLPAADRLAQVLAETPDVAFAALVGSRANHTARDNSDWDIAVCWKSGADRFARLGQHEALRHRLAQSLEIQDEQIDLIDLSSARLAMKAVVAEKGTVLTLVECSA